MTYPAGKAGPLPIDNPRMMAATPRRPVCLRASLGRANVGWSPMATPSIGSIHSNSESNHNDQFVRTALLRDASWGRDRLGARVPARSATYETAHHVGTERTARHAESTFPTVGYPNVRYWRSSVHSSTALTAKAVARQNNTQTLCCKPPSPNPFRTTRPRFEPRERERGVPNPRTVTSPALSKRHRCRSPYPEP